MNPHKVYGIVISAIVVIAGVAGTAAFEHAKDDAKRDAVIDAQKTDIGMLEQKISQEESAALARIADLEKQKQTVVHEPQQAPTIIREVLPRLEQQPITKDTLPDAPSATLSRQDEQDLAQYILACKQCGVENDQLKAKVSDQQEIIDRQNTELGAAMKAAKGGSVWQRTKRIAKWGALLGGTGYVIGRAQR